MSNKFEKLSGVVASGLLLDADETLVTIFHE